MLDHQPNAIRHAQKSRIVGVDAVHGKVVGVGDHAEAEAVHKVDVLVPLCRASLRCCGTRLYNRPLFFSKESVA